MYTYARPASAAVLSGYSFPSYREMPERLESAARLAPNPESPPSNVGPSMEVQGLRRGSVHRIAGQYYYCDDRNASSFKVLPESISTMRPPVVPPRFAHLIPKWDDVSPPPRYEALPAKHDFEVLAAVAEVESRWTPAETTGLRTTTNLPSWAGEGIEQRGCSPPRGYTGLERHIVPIVGPRIALPPSSQQTPYARTPHLTSSFPSFAWPALPSYPTTSLMARDFSRSSTSSSAHSDTDPQLSPPQLRHHSVNPAYLSHGQHLAALRDAPLPDDSRHSDPSLSSTTFPLLARPLSISPTATAYRFGTGVNERESREHELDRRNARPVRVRTSSARQRQQEDREYKDSDEEQNELDQDSMADDSDTTSKARRPNKNSAGIASLKNIFHPSPAMMLAPNAPPQLHQKGSGPAPFPGTNTVGLPTDEEFAKIKLTKKSRGRQPLALGTASGRKNRGKKGNAEEVDLEGWAGMTKSGSPKKLFVALSLRFLRNGGADVE